MMLVNAFRVKLHELSFLWFLCVLVSNAIRPGPDSLTVICSIMGAIAPSILILDEPSPDPRRQPSVSVK